MALLNINDAGEYQVVGVYSTENKRVVEWNVSFTGRTDTPKCGYDLSKCPSKLLFLNILNCINGFYIFYIKCANNSV